MAYINLNVKDLRRFCEGVFIKSGYSQEESSIIADVLLTADLYGIESHGVQRLIRYYNAMREGFIVSDAKCETVFQTSISAVLDAPRSMGQVVAKKGMNMAIDMAKQHGIGMVCVRNSNHYGIAGYYTSMAADADMLGICMTNTEAIAIPTHGRKAMLGTNPIAVCMPADPVNFWFDAATTVITRGKLEVYRKKELPLPDGWAADEKGQSSDNANKVLENIIGKFGGGIFPVGGFSEATGSHKGYGLGIMVELFTSVFSGGTASAHVSNSGNADTSFCFWAVDYGIFGDKKEIKARMSTMLQELRDSPKANGSKRIYTHGEKELISAAQKLKDGVPVNDKTLAEMKMISGQLGLDFNSYFTL